MPIDHEALAAALKRLQTEHERSQYKDPSDRVRTEELIADLERELRHPDPQATQGEVTRRVHEAIEAFEIEHPQVTAALSQVIDILTSMGI